jgi:hypothetical protein
MRKLASVFERMSLIEEVETKLQKYPRAKYERDGESIRVLPLSDGGFSVWLIERAHDYAVHFEGWHEEFEDEDEALDCFAFGLSSDCRLRECGRGGVAYKWTVESLEEGRWISGSTTGLLFFPFWKRREVRYLQNSLLREESADS